MRSLLFAAATSAAVLVPAVLASQQPPPARTALDAPRGPVAVRHQPPVEAPVVDHFRPPTTPYGPGNRGIDYATGEGNPVRASADGEVVFAGAVAGSLHVVILHDDGIRTSYSFLATIGVRRGQRVSTG
ncbi:MAG: M23 family metallopeptidase, partial [Actinomycetota bacterium]|nr:M23 family metallopeptidase [Actinomycetota bacterium]